MCGSAFDQLRALLLRNLLMKRNGWKQFVYEICLPVVITLLTAVVNTNLDNVEFDQVKRFPTYNLTGNSVFGLPGTNPHFLAQFFSNVSEASYCG